MKLNKLIYALLLTLLIVAISGCGKKSTINIEVDDELSVELELGDVMPDWTDYFNVTDKHGKVFVTDEMISHDVQMTEVGEYNVRLEVEIEENYAAKVIDVSVVDTTGPNISLSQYEATMPTVFKLNSGKPDFSLYYNAIDPSGDVDIIVKENVNMSVAGVYEVIITAKDKYDNESSESLEIVVYDHTTEIVESNLGITNQDIYTINTSREIESVQITGNYCSTKNISFSATTNVTIPLNCGNGIYTITLTDIYDNTHLTYIKLEMSNPSY